MGSMFIISAKGKVTDVHGFAEKNDLPYPVGVAVVATEGIAGLALVTGILPRFASLSIMGLMTGTMYKHIVQWKSPYWAKDGGWEYDLIWFSMAGIIAAEGGGDYSIPRLFDRFILPNAELPSVTQLTVALERSRLSD
jgi:uncharacterized membrane protein YphA (DoxX/SURF4 family)